MLDFMTSLRPGIPARERPPGEGLMIFEFLNVCRDFHSAEIMVFIETIGMDAEPAAAKEACDDLMVILKASEKDPEYRKRLSEGLSGQSDLRDVFAEKVGKSEDDKDGAIRLMRIDRLGEIWMHACEKIEDLFDLDPVQIVAVANGASLEKVKADSDDLLGCENYCFERGERLSSEDFSVVHLHSCIRKGIIKKSDLVEDQKEDDSPEP